MKAKIVMAAVLAVLSTSVMAQSKDQSLSVFGNYSKTSGQDGGTGILMGSYGFMPTENIEVGFSLGAVFVSGTDSDTMTLAGASAKYYFGAIGRAGAMVPYVKADIQSFDGESAYGGGVGIDYGLSESASLFLEAVAHKSTDSDASGTTTQLNLGLYYRF
jgi:hypothetical protein